MTDDRSRGSAGARIVETASGLVQIDARSELNPEERQLISFELERIGAGVRLTAYANSPMTTVVELDNWQADWLAQWLSKS